MVVSANIPRRCCPVDGLCGVTSVARGSLSCKFPVVVTSVLTVLSGIIPVVSVKGELVVLPLVVSQLVVSPLVVSPLSAVAICLTES